MQTPHWERYTSLQPKKKMKLAFGICFVTVVCAAPFNSEFDAKWEEFKTKYGKKYSSEEEGAKRLIWEENADKIVKHNSEYDLGKHSYSLGLNEYSDVSHQEFISKTKDFQRPNRIIGSSVTFLPPSNAKLPKTVDWRTKGYVTPVKNERNCNAAWAFSVTGSLEGQQKNISGKLVSLSAQNLIDCTKDYGNYGCQGGDYLMSFDYLQFTSPGIDTEASYPFEARDGPCRYNYSNNGVLMSDYTVLTPNERALQIATATVGPISVGIDASSEKFQHYSGGIYDDPDCITNFPYHGALVVGYGTENGKDYWLVKNSWGESWGINGYIKMSRNKDNQCSIATQAIYPTVIPLQ